ncbi:hypothetical protein HYFRA_00001234 [Hymenoscyphus fraxineus]|uniref:Uncharacterized protein n=1 Tax=Hymenoscyphus fraxineus TaxID=746836 RepID=A0A9N9KUY6_9HELO|nr:hypothetical protein HYFRA_00001234 [Hymenoscyphus fraxineus]
MADWMQGNGTPSKPMPSRPGSNAGSNAQYAYPSQQAFLSTPQNQQPLNGAWTNSRRPNVPLTANGVPAFPSNGPQWNPNQLLNPRAPQQASREDYSNQTNTSNFTSAPQLDFQFDTTAGRQQETSHAHPSTPMYNGNGSNTNGQDQFTSLPNGNGAMGSVGQMLERVHNVADRSMVPQKRKKVDDPREDGGRKAQFNGGGKGGVLGQYVNEKRKEGAQQATSNGKVVDISIDDDDDVQIMADPGDVEVCYGRIEGVELNAHQVPTPKPGTISVSKGFWPQVKIQLRRTQGERSTQIYARDGTREVIGCIDVNTAIGLCPLLDAKFNIRTASRILTRLKRPDDLPPGAKTSQRYGLDLNIYGPKKHAIQIGRHLAQKQLWLRTPLFVEAGTELYNPHVIEKPVQVAPRLTSSYGHQSQGPMRTTEEIRNDVLGMFDSLEQSENLPEMDPNHRITTELLKHQKQGLSFMISKEKERVFSNDEKGNSSLWRRNVVGGATRYINVITGQEMRESPPQVFGGILADMMGLGKTLSILSLITQTLDTEASRWASMDPRAERDDRELCAAKRGKKALPKIEQTPLVRNCKTTLLVSPLSTITNWEDQIKQHVKPGTLKYYIYHGSGRIKDINKLAEFDVVITTYGSVATEFNYRSKNKPGIYPLEAMNWFRIVLDEAHMIREQSTQQSKAICRLQASRRWAVTGTPVQNRLEDLGALMAFLRVKPFDEKGGFAQYIMAPFKLCDPEILPKLRLLVDSITLRRLKDRIDLPPRHDHLVKLDFNSEERQIYEIFAKNASDRVKVIVGQREKSLGGKSYVHILQSILRLRLICAHGRDLLCEEDLQVMYGLSKDSAIELDSDDEDDRPALSSKQAYDMYNLMVETNADVCASCNRKVGTKDEALEVDGDAKDETIGHMTPCFHILCPSCFGGYKSQLEQLARGSQMVDCTVCYQHIRLSFFALQPRGGVENAGPKVKEKSAGKTLENYSGPHTKTSALVADLLRSKYESSLKPDEPPIKSVVFSGWTAHLDLIQLALQQNDIKYTRLDGKMTRTARGAAMDNFRTDPSILVILVSIMAGGLGLNLTTANKVYVMEPQYNPAAEAQAVDRVHRLGQKREVTTVRYIMNDSFEEKMLELQEKKKKLASISMDKEAGRIDKMDAARKRLEDLRSLFK